MSEIAASPYVLGHDDRELRRLAFQASILNPVTEQLLRRAGLSAGMSVLDFGCGVGDISVIAAHLVGPSGRVTGVDIDEGTLSIARGRVLERGLTNVCFVQSNVLDFRPGGLVDVTTGRHILIHVPEPLALVETSFSALKRGGIAIFQEYDFSVVHPAYPRAPLRERCAEIFREFFRRATRDNMGAQLYHLVSKAGFSSVDCRAEYAIDGGAGSPCYEWFAESLRAILPRAEALGVISTSEIDVGTLAEELRLEAVANESSFPAPVMVGCIGRKP
jgi:ubiquinone/menaquinone biosynthesis C-methylase UbiE